MHHFPLILSLLSFCVFFVQSEVFTSMATMERILGAENSVSSIIDQYVEKEKLRLKKIKDFADEYHKANLKSIEDGHHAISNPVNAYLLIKRLTSDWDYVTTLMKHNLADVFLANVTENREVRQIRFPDSEDLDGAAVALLRLQDTYRLDTREIADGKIKGVTGSGELNAHDCYMLGRTAYKQNDFYHTALWMQESLNRFENEQSSTADEADILEHLSFSLYHTGNVKRALALAKKVAFLNPNHPRIQGNIKWYEDELANLGQKKDTAELPPLTLRRSNDNYLPERDIYEALCRGEVPVSEKTKAKCYCYYKRDRAYLKLAPIKVEIVHLNPLAVVFRDVINDDEIAVIKMLATPKLARATVHNKDTGELEIASYRISRSAWLKAHEHEVVERLNKRMDMMTNLNIDTAEETQVANYGLGGHYDPHFDFARVSHGRCGVANYGLGGHYEPHYDMSTKDEPRAFESLGTGNRIATILFYMSQPEAGSATVFVELKASVFPTIHDALFWYNLYRDGDGDLRTRHAACPVLSGDKWVSNKWIHERGQEFRRPCALRRSINENYVGEL